MRRIVALALLAVGCVPPAPVTPPPDAADAALVSPPSSLLPLEGAAPFVDPTTASCSAACSNLYRLGCPEGVRLDCASNCVHAETIVDLKPRCLAEAGTVADVRRCGTLGGRDGGCAK